MGDLYQFFTDAELRCPCGCGCGAMSMDPEFMHKIQIARAVINKPFVVVRGGGFRCKKYDKEVGTSDTPGWGPHTFGKALDIVADSAFASAVTEIMIRMHPEISRFGYSTLSMHMDACGAMEAKPTNRIWVFSQALVMP